MKSTYQLIVAVALAITLLGWMANQPESPLESVNLRQVNPKVISHHQHEHRPDIPGYVAKPVVANSDSTIGKKVHYTPPPLPNLEALRLPQTESGGVMLFPVDTGEAAGHIEIQPELRDPLTALGACSRWIVSCVAPGARSLDDCARSAPQCETEEPWNEETHCCPTTCFENYETIRKTGVEPMSAFDAVYFEDGSCFPGLQDLLSGASVAPKAPPKPR